MSSESVGQTWLNPCTISGLVYGFEYHFKWTTEFISDLGGSLTTSESRSKAEVWYDWVENARHHKRRMANRGFRDQRESGWRCRDFSTNFFIALKFNQYGRYLSLISVKGSDRRLRVSLVIKKKNRAVIILPESAFNEGWEKLAKKIETFINRGIKQTKALKLSGEADYDANKGGRSYRDVLQKKLAEEGSMLKARVQLEDEDLLKSSRTYFDGWLEKTREQIKASMANNEGNWRSIADEESIFSLPIWVESLVTFRKKYDEEVCTSMERDEGGYRGRNPSDLSRCRDIHRSEKLSVKPNREEKVFFGERSHMGGKITKGATSEQIEGHLVLNPGPSGLVKSPIFKRLPDRT
ncbi:hypothetical protein H5410_040087 [Solanum commersonii]|uniref:Uncharacterized protein n=1 Tax=Solanum commersonii TaxID=4109 RepID=A0A9J5XP28_SOLCO|nr:hypothetical protein H5410_040087 [Solanum commersonii]